MKKWYTCVDDNNRVIQLRNDVLIYNQRHLNSQTTIECNDKSVVKWRTKCKRWNSEWHEECSNQHVKNEYPLFIDCFVHFLEHAENLIMIRIMYWSSCYVHVDWKFIERFKTEMKIKHFFFLFFSLCNRFIFQFLCSGAHAYSLYDTDTNIIWRSK